MKAALIKAGWHSCRLRTRRTRNGIPPWASLAVAWVMFPVGVSATDYLHLHDGRVLQGEITRVASTSVSIKLKLPGVAGTAHREISMDSVEFIDFEPLAGETEALSNPESPTSQVRLKELWAETSNLLPFPENNAGQIGLHVAAQLVQTNDATYQERALGIYRMIEKDDWNEAHRAEAQKGKLRTLIQLQRISEAMAEARQLAQTTEDPSLVIEAQLVLAKGDFERLKAFEIEQPRWMDDDELTSERTALYHQVLDQFLHAPLFHGSVDDKAAEALWKVVEVHQFNGDEEAARQRATDLLALYPNMPEAALAQAFLSKNTESSE